MEPFLTSPAASVAVVEATTNSSDAGGVQREAGDGCRSGLVPDVVPLEDSGDALEPPTKHVCFSDSFATPPNKFGNLETSLLEPGHPHIVANGNPDPLTCQGDTDIRDPRRQLGQTHKDEVEQKTEGECVVRFLLASERFAYAHDLQCMLSALSLPALPAVE